MKYIINQSFDKIIEENKTILFTDAVDNVYILNEIESKIWQLFSSPCDINDAYETLGTLIDWVRIREEDFYDFIRHLIQRKILVAFNDKNNYSVCQ